VADKKGQTIIQKRVDKGIWHNLYEFPLIETDKEEDFDYIAKRIKQEFFKENSITSILEYNQKSIVHKLSHQHLYIKFWKVNLSDCIKNGVSSMVLKTFPFPIVIHNFIEANAVS
jgi:A/G-specific adenine glycosylase